MISSKLKSCKAKGLSQKEWYGGRHDFEFRRQGKTGAPYDAAQRSTDNPPPPTTESQPALPNISSWPKALLLASSKVPEHSITDY